MVKGVINLGATLTGRRSLAISLVIYHVGSMAYAGKIVMGDILDVSVTKDGAEQDAKSRYARAQRTTVTDVVFAQIWMGRKLVTVNQTITANHVSLNIWTCHHQLRCAM
jgi:hypothetical protein